jgi:hypothetical protein
MAATVAERRSGVPTVVRELAAGGLSCMLASSGPCRVRSMRMRIDRLSMAPCTLRMVLGPVLNPLDAVKVRMQVQPASLVCVPALRLRAPRV